MCNVNMYEAKTNLSKYVDMLERGDESEIFLCRRGKKVAKLVLVEDEPKKSLLGAGVGILPDKPYVLDSDEYGIDELFYGKEYL